MSNKSILEKSVNEWPDTRGRGKEEKQAKAEQQSDHGNHPPHFLTPEEGQKFTGYGETLA